MNLYCAYHMQGCIFFLSGAISWGWSESWSKCASLSARMVCEGWTVRWCLWWGWAGPWRSPQPLSAYEPLVPRSTCKHMSLKIIRCMQEGCQFPIMAVLTNKCIQKLLFLAYRALGHRPAFHVSHGCQTGTCITLMSAIYACMIVCTFANLVRKNLICVV